MNSEVATQPHQDWTPALIAAVGSTNIKQELRSDINVGGRENKAHLDGHDMLDILASKAKRSPRDKFFYVSNDGQFHAIRTGDWKVVFSGQRARGVAV